MNAARQSSKSTLRTFFSSLPLPTPIAVQSKGKRKTKANTNTNAKKETTQPQPQPQPKAVVKPYTKKKITGALREAVWIKTMGKVFEGKCPVVWCPNTITVFDFQSGHNIPESKGGSTTLPNLIPICARCNFSMGNHYTIDEWNALHASAAAITTTTEEQSQKQKQKQPSFVKKFFCCFFNRSN